MSKFMGLVAFIGLMIHSGGTNVGGAIAGGLFVWAFNVYLWAPNNQPRYDGQGNRRDTGPYVDPH